MQHHNLSESSRRQYETTADDLDALVDRNDLSELTPVQRRRYYVDFCREHGLNPRLKPFMWLWTKDRRLILYCPKAGSDQLRKVHGVSITAVDTTFHDGCIVVKVTAATPDGRTDFDIGSVNLHRITGADRSNAIMTAVTKGKRRVTIAICGVGLLDELEVATMDGVSTADIDLETGELTGEQMAEVLRTGIELKSTPEQIRCFYAITRDLEWTAAEWHELLRRHGYTQPNEIGRFHQFDVIKEQLSDITVRNTIRSEIAAGGEESRADEPNQPSDDADSHIHGE